MKKQRTLFLHQKPEHSPKKNGDNPLVPDRRHTAIDLGELEIRFDNPTATACGGYPAWGLFLDRIGLAAEFAHHLKMNRGPLAFTAPELSRFLVDIRILGAERLMHAERFRLDPMLTNSCGIDGLPSGKTLGVYLKEYNEGHLESFDHLNVKMNRKLWKETFGKNAKKRIILDYDSSTITVYGKQEGADRGRCFRHKDKPGFQPKFAFIGGLGLMVNQKLLPQSHNLTMGFQEFHEDTCAKLPRKVEIWAVRGDSAIYSLDNIRYFEKEHLVYALSVPCNSPLRDMILDIPESQWIEDKDEYGQPISVARLSYCPPTWKEEGERERTVVVSRRIKEDPQQGVIWAGERFKYFAYMTNFRSTVVEQFRFAVERCSLESFVKESKNGFHYDFLPCQEEMANRAYLAHIQLAYNLAIFWKKLATPRGINRWTIQTLRDRVLLIAGNVYREAKKWIVSLAEWWPYRTVYEQIWRRCEDFAPT